MSVYNPFTVSETKDLRYSLSSAFSTKYISFAPYLHLFFLLVIKFNIGKIKFTFMLFKFIRAIPLYDITRTEKFYVFTATNLKISQFLTAVNSLSIIF